MAALISRHPPLLRSEFRRSVYGIPSTYVLFLVVALTVAAVGNSKRFARPLIQAFLLLLVTGNVWALEDHRCIIRSGHLSERYELTAGLLEALRHPNGPQEAPPATIAGDPIYIALRAYSRR